MSLKLTVEPLQKRASDIPLLIDYFSQKKYALNYNLKELKD